MKLNGKVWHCFSEVMPIEQAIEIYLFRYGEEPMRYVTQSGLHWLGPVKEISPAATGLDGSEGLEQAVLL